MRVEVDYELCIGSGNCVRLAPGKLELGDDGIAAPVPSEEVDAGLAEQLIASCPMGAILAAGDQTA